MVYIRPEGVHIMILVNNGGARARSRIIKKTTLPQLASPPPRIGYLLSEPMKKIQMHGYSYTAARARASAIELCARPIGIALGPN